MSRFITKQNRRLVGFTVLWLAISQTPLELTLAQQIRSAEEAARIVTIESLKINRGMVSGEVRNKAKHAVRDVQLFIRYTWLWEDERKPGSPDPGTSTYYVLRQEIAPGATLRFTYKPSPPLPSIPGGRFDTSVKVAGFTEIIPQNKN